MSIRSSIYTLLSGIEVDVFPLVAPQETSDTYVTYAMRLEFERYQGGYIKNVTLTLDVWGNQDNVISMADTLVTGLEGQSGTVGDQTLIICNWVSESESYIPDLDKFNITQEYELKFE